MASNEILGARERIQFESRLQRLRLSFLLTPLLVLASSGPSAGAYAVSIVIAVAASYAWVALLLRFKPSLLLRLQLVLRALDCVLVYIVLVNYLSAGRGELANLFASKEPDKFQNVSWRPAANGMPWLHTDTIAHAECDVSQELDAGDHLIFLGQVIDGQPPAPGTKPLMYFRRTYGTWDD